MTEQPQSAQPPGAPPILSNTPGSFAWGVLHNRHPALIKQVRDGLPYPPALQRALDRLADEITGTIKPLRRDAHDHKTWDTWGSEYFGQQWPDVPFLWAESYFYRKLLDAVGYFDAGPWRGIDPFEPVKSAELLDPDLHSDLTALDQLPALSAAEQAETLTHTSLWGNRADLGFQITAAPALPTSEHTSELLVDQSAPLWSLLNADSTRTVCVVADNAARELLPDLLLIDHLLHTGRVEYVALHVKPYPYYVSDATNSDVISCLRRLANAPGRAAEVGHRLWRAISNGTLTVQAHAFYCAPWSFHHMPNDLTTEIAATSLTIMKGDLNYRRLVGDQAWSATASFDTLTAYFPGQVAVLRTLKSDVVVGLPKDVLSSLEGTGEPWRTNGTRALIQLRG